MSLHVHIDRVILDGVPLGQAERERLRERLSAALGELFAQGELDWSQLRAECLVRGPTLTLPLQLSTTGLAESVANSVHAGLSSQLESGPASSAAGPEGGPVHG